MERRGKCFRQEQSMCKGPVVGGCTVNKELKEPGEQGRKTPVTQDAAEGH
jgi:hypothetical protein